MIRFLAFPLAVASLTMALANPNMSAAAPALAAVVPPPAIEVTQQDVAASNQKVKMAHAALVAMWSADFAKLGQRFYAPDIVGYFGGARTACGIMRSSNAIYCPRDNTIYFDEIFVAGQAKSAAQSLGTDGDMAAIGIIAHEMGHAVATQLGHVSRIPYENESTADCLAGAFARQATKDGSIEKGDIDEAFFAMSNAGDPAPELTGNRRTDGWILARAALAGHGTREQRMQNFKTGLDGGPPACMPELANIP